MSSINVNPTLLAAQNLGNRIQRGTDSGTAFRAAVARAGDGQDQRPSRQAAAAANNSARNTQQSSSTGGASDASANPYLAGRNAANLSARGAAAALPNRRPLPPGSLLNIVV